MPHPRSNRAIVLHGCFLVCYPEIVAGKEPQPQAFHPSADASKKHVLIPHGACSSEVVVVFLGKTAVATVTNTIQAKTEAALTTITHCHSATQADNTGQIFGSCLQAISAQSSGLIGTASA